MNTMGENSTTAPANGGASYSSASTAASAGTAAIAARYVMTSDHDTSPGRPNAVSQPSSGNPMRPYRYGTSAAKPASTNARPEPCRSSAVARKNEASPSWK